jgi:hypothetical protein
MRDAVELPMDVSWFLELEEELGLFGKITLSVLGPEHAA